jgi:methyl-accepting chemotaxis protein
MFAAPVLANDNPGAPVVGEVVARLDGSSALSDLVDSIEMRFPSGYAFMVNDSGTFVAYPDNDRVLNQFNIINEAQGDPALSSMANMVKEAIQQRSGFGYYVFDNVSYKCAYAEVPGYPWLLFVAMREDEIWDEFFSKGRIQCINTALIIGSGFCKIYCKGSAPESDAVQLFDNFICFFVSYLYKRIIIQNTDKPDIFSGC